MLGKASEIKVKIVEGHYLYPKGDPSITNRRWVTL